MTHKIKQGFAARTRLTLILDKGIIEEAKSYAKENKVSLSKLIENYLSSLTKTPDRKDIKISPLVESLTGIISPDVDERKSKIRYFTLKQR
jgi:hypothetical protein